MTRTVIGAVPTVRVEPAYEATLNHCDLIRRKVDRLQETLAASMVQLFVSANREYHAGNVTLDDLGVLYNRARALGPGFSAVWDRNMSIKAAAIRHHMRYRPSAANAGGGVYWSGPYPYETTTPRPVRGVAVVYVLYDATNEPIYLGSSACFGDRMRAHRKSGKAFVWWMAYPCGSREAAYLLEGGLLAARKPPLNVKAGR